MQNPIVINITNLIGTLVIDGDLENIPTQIEEKVKESLLKVLATVQNLENPELCLDKTSLESEVPQN